MSIIWFPKSLRKKQILYIITIFAYVSAANLPLDLKLLMFGNEYSKSIIYTN